MARSRDGVGMNRSAREVKCKVLCSLDTVLYKNIHLHLCYLPGRREIASGWTMVDQFWTTWVSCPPGLASIDKTAHRKMRLQEITNNNNFIIINIFYSR